MTETKNTCQVCNTHLTEQRTCKSCGKTYCPRCQSPSTNQHFCKNCVRVDGVVSKQ